VSTIPRRQPAVFESDAVTDAQLPTPSRELVRTSSGEHVRLYVRRLIFDGILRQGQRVPQDAIAERLGVSRIPVREALIALEREGWMTIVPHRGVFVNALDELSVRDHYELYGLFYGFAVRRAVEREGAELVARLAPIQREIVKVAKAGDAARLHELILDFHRAIVDAAHSPRLRNVLRQMTDIVPGNFFELVPNADTVGRRGVTAIVSAIRKGDAEAAEREYATMLRRQGDLVVELFRERGMFEQPAEAGS
jgi:DNA-binding GntR family transcriptional regulator